MLRHLDQLTLSDMEAFLTELAGPLASRGMPGYGAIRGPRFEAPAPRTALEHSWVLHIAGLGASLRPVGTVRTSIDARRVHRLDVTRGRIAAEHGKYRVEITIDPPPFGERFEAVRAYLSERGSGLCDALRDGMAARSDILLPTLRSIHSRCSCPRSTRICTHGLAVLAAFGARLDGEPMLLVRLRGLEVLELSPRPLSAARPPVTGDLAALFGIDLEGTESTTAPPLPPAEQKEVRREHLRVLGFKSRTIDEWLRQGVLGRTQSHDVYVRTPEANRRIARYLAR